MKILIVEDDILVSQALAAILDNQNYVVEIANDGLSAWELIDNFDYDLLLVDVMLPKLDGISLCRQVRAHGRNVPIILLTGRDSSHEKAVGLDAGADDYLVKPFDTEELLARIRALLRRGVTLQPVLEWGKLRLDPTSCEVSYDNQLVPLTPKEYSLLELFLRNSRRVFSCGMILEHLWSYEDTPGEEAVRTHIKGLRHKLKEKGASSNLIETVYGIGYRLKPQSESNESKHKQTDELEVNLPSQLKSQPDVLSINKVWQKFTGRVTEKINILEQAAQALNQNTLNQELHFQAEKEAHMLAGSLGTYGFSKASLFAKEIEQLLKVKSTSSIDVVKISSLVRALQREIELSPQEGKYTNDALSLQVHPLVLVIDQDFTFTEQLAQESANWDLQVTLATNITTARSKLYQEHPSVVLLDTSVLTEDESLKLLVEFSARKPAVPVLICSQNRPSGCLGITYNDGITFLQKPCVPIKVLETVKQVLQKAALTQVKVLAVDDDPNILASLQTLLTPWGLTVKTLAEPNAFWQTLEAFKPDLLILDVEMPGVNGIDLCSLVRNHSHWSELPILFLTLYSHADIINQVFSVGADDFVSKPFVGPELVTRIINRLERIKLVRQAAQQTAQQESQRLALFLSAAEIGTWDWNILTDQIIWSETHERLFGMIPGSFDGTFDTFINCVLEADRETLRLKISQVRLEHTNYHHEFRIIWKDGSIHWIEMRGKFYYDNAGEAVQMLGTVADISTRKQIEADLRKSNNELEKKLAESTSDLIRANEYLLELYELNARVQNFLRNKKISV